MEQQKTANPLARSNRRRQPRIPIPTNGRITVYLEDGHGKRRSIEVRALDASRTGILVQSDHPIPAGTVGFLQAATFPLAGRQPFATAGSKAWATRSACIFQTL